MKKLVAALTFFIGFSAQANIISVEVSNTVVSVGETVDVMVVADMSEDFDTLDLQLDFDVSLFDFDASTLTSDLTIFSDFVFEQTEQAFGFASSFINFTPVFDGLYFVANFSVTALAEGTSTFTLNNVTASLTDMTTFQPIPIELSLGFPATVTVTASEVAAPSTIALTLLTALCLISLRRKV